MPDISSTGISFRLVLSETYPNGITLTGIADDTDPLDIPELTIAEAAMTANGDLVSWTAPKPIPIKIALYPGGEDDIALQYAYNANRAAKGKKVAKDVVTLIASYADGSTASLSKGILTTYTPAKSATSAGRYKSPAFGMTFTDITLGKATN